MLVRCAFAVSRRVIAHHSLSFDDVPRGDLLAQLTQRLAVDDLEQYAEDLARSRLVRTAVVSHWNVELRKISRCAFQMELAITSWHP